MTQLLRMGGNGQGTVPFVHFDRAELSRLFALYSQRVAEGEWKDYAIDQQPDRAVFAVYRHALDSPLFTISKFGRGWEVASGLRKLRRADTLDDILTIFDRALRLVTH